jgi:hypothetical protein
MSAVVAQVHGLGRLVARLVEPVTSRKYLVGAVLAWVLIVYLASGPSEIVSPTPRSAPTRAVPPPALAAPGPSLDAVPSFAPETAPPEPSFGFSPLSFPPPPAPPPAPEPLSCPLPLPQAQSAPLSAGIFLSFEGPLTELSGPFAQYNIPTLGAIGPLVPFATPLVTISQPVLNEVTPNLSVLVTDYVTIVDALGLDSPQAQQYAAEFEPYWVQLLSTFTPAEQTFASSTPGQCLVLFENALAVAASQQNLQLPPLPLLPAGVPPGSTSSTAAVERATVADTHAPVGQLVLPWSAGVPAGLGRAVATLRSEGEPVELELVDQPPAGQALGGTGFADFVAQVVHDAPQASAVQVDAPSADPSGPSQIADLVHGLASADFTRQPGELIGVGVPGTAEGAGATAFWQAFGAAMEGWQHIVVDFVGADLTPTAAPSVAADAVEAAGMARALRAACRAFGGLPATLPLFASVGLASGVPVTDASVQQQIASYLAALSGLHVVAIGIRTG